MRRRPYEEIGRTLRAVFNIDRKPLPWKMIDIIETLAEQSDVAETAIEAADGSEERSSGQKVW